MENTDNSFEEFFGAFEGEDGSQTDAAEETAETETSEEATEKVAEEAQDQPDGGETAEEVTEEEAEKDGAEGSDKGDGRDAQKFISVKYDKEMRQVSMEDAPEWIQKGMNYDRVKDQLEASRQSEQSLQAKLDEQQEYMEILTLISEKTKLPVGDLLEQMHVNAVKGPDQTEAEARALIRAEKAERQLKAKTDQQKQQEAAESEQSGRMQRELTEFRQQFPDVKLDDELAAKLRPDIQAGMSLTSAYLKQENARKDAEIASLKKEQETQQAAAAQNKKNRAKAPGSQRDSGGQRAKDAADDFFTAFEK